MKKNIIGGDFNTFLISNLDKFEGIKGTHQKCRDRIIASIDNFDLAGVWRVLIQLYANIRGSFGKFLAWHHNSTMR